MAIQTNNGYDRVISLDSGALMFLASKIPRENFEIRVVDGTATSSADGTPEHLTFFQDRDNSFNLRASKRSIESCGDIPAYRPYLPFELSWPHIIPTLQDGQKEWLKEDRKKMINRSVPSSGSLTTQPQSWSMPIAEIPLQPNFYLPSNLEIIAYCREKGKTILAYEQGLAVQEELSILSRFAVVLKQRLSR